MRRSILVPLALAVGACLVSTPPTARAVTPGTLTLSAQGELGIPTGDYADVAEKGFSGTLSGDYWLSRYVALGADLGFHRWNATDELNAATSMVLSMLLSPQVVNAEVKFGALQYTAHAKFAIPTESERIVPWVQVGLGNYDLEIEVDTDVLGSQSDSQTYFGFHLGTGVDFVVSPRLRLGGGATYHRLASEDDLGADATQLSVGARLSVDFGR